MWSIFCELVHLYESSNTTDSLERIRLFYKDCLHHPGTLRALTFCSPAEYCSYAWSLLTFRWLLPNTVPTTVANIKHGSLSPTLMFSISGHNALLNFIWHRAVTQFHFPPQDDMLDCDFLTVSSPYSHSLPQIQQSQEVSHQQGLHISDSARESC